MKREALESYIYKRIRKDISYSAAVGSALANDGSGKTAAQIAKLEAQDGFIAATASHLFRDRTLSYRKKGKILAKAYARAAEKSVYHAEHIGMPGLEAMYRDEARHFKKVAQGLATAASRLKK